MTTRDDPLSALTSTSSGDLTATSSGAVTALTDPLRHLGFELRDLEDRGLLRSPPEPMPRVEAAGERLLLLCSNDYLGYGAEPWDDSGSLEAAGAGASRLVSGEHIAHIEAETEIAAWLRREASLLFTSGYAANVGAIAALAGPGDLIVSDALNHASIIDGCRLSGARVVVVPHCDSVAVERALAEGRESRRRWVVTETYFSMDGDSPDLGALRSICDAHDAALYVDEAHALGVFGPEGRGLCAEALVEPDVFVGTLGKALGLQGAFVCGGETLRRYLWNRARSFVFSTGVSPALAARVRESVRRARADDGGRERLHASARRLRDGLRGLGVGFGARVRGPILPWVVGSSGAAIGLSERLRERGVRVQAIRPPTVPVETARLRITVTARLTDGEIERALGAFAQVLRS